MNTKGIKFLAVLAVMVMAFAAVFVLAPADNEDAVVVFGDDTVVVDPTVIDDNVTASKFYISDDLTVKIKNIVADDLTFYVQNGAELELDFKATTSSAIVSKPITIVTVTGDQQRITTSTINATTSTTTTTPGKIVIGDTVFTFTGADKQNVVYVAMMPKDVTTTITTSGFETNVTTDGNALISASEVLVGASTGSKVAVAPSQSIEATSELSSLVYGVAHKDGSVYTYYATGMNAGSLTIDATTDNVIIKDGSAIVNNGTSSIKATSAKGDKSVTLTYVEDGQTKVAGKLKSGSMNVSGKVLFDTSFENKATITLNANADVVSGSAMKVTGTLVLKNEESKACNLKVSGTGFIVAENEKIWHYTGTTPTLKFADGSDFTGQYDVSAINKSADVFDSFSNAKIEKNQTFRMIGDTVIANEFIIEGILYIEPGVTLTITQTNNYGASVTVQGQYAQIVNNGTIVVKTTTPYSSNPIGMHILGGSLLNYGTINASSASGAAGYQTFTVNYAADPTDYPGGYGVVNGGAISIGKHDTASLDDKFTNEGTVTVNGSFYGTNFVNGGTFTLSSAKIVDDLNVTMSKGSVFAINSVEVTQGKTITIQNSPNTAGTVYANTISFTAAGTGSSDDKVRITGVTIVDSSNKLQGNKLDLSGSIGTSIPSTITDNAFNVIATKGHIDVTGTVTINKGYQLDFTESTNLDVSGKVNIDKDVKLVTATTVSNLTMPVIGVVTDMAKILTGVNYVGAMYSTPSADIYTNLEDAIAAAIEAEVPQINVNSVDTAFYYVTVSDDLVIPEGLTVDGNYLVVDDKATILVQSGGRFSFDMIVIEDGLISAEDVNDIDYDEIVADVKTEDDESTAAACMSLEVALMLATPGSVIELSNTFYAADADLVIPADVTVDATATNGTDFVLVNSNLTVNGMLIVDQFAFVATTDDTIGITVNGFIYDKCSDGACFVKWWYNPFGVSYYFTDDEDHTWYVLTTIENIQPAIDVADDAKVYVEGDAYLDELTVSGRDDMPGEVTFKGNVDIDTINIDEVTLIFKDGKEVNTTVKNSVGSITITGAYVDKYMSIYDMAIYSSEDVGVYMEGVLTDNVYGTYGVLFEGITGMDGTDVKTATNYGNYDEGTPTIVFAGATTVIGKKVYISDDDEYFIGPTTTVTGGLYVANNAKLTINGDVQVLGSLVAADRTEEGNPGAINANGNIFVGMLVSDIYYMDAYPPVPTTATGDAAILSGKVALAAGKNIYVAPAAIVDPEIVDDLDTMGIYIDDELWFTLYGYENDKFTLNGLMVPMLNAEIYSILDENLDGVAAWAGNIIILSESKTLSGFGNVYITLDYHIFEVKIKTDGSVKAVYIDGILMETGESKNIFIMKNVAAGTHEVKVEAATGYDASKCVLYTEMGTILPNMGFTFTQFDCTETDIDPVTEDEIPVVVYNIKGTEIQPEPVPPTPEEESQWTVTTILLVILVVLIAIMAVIVALRLNRS